MGKSVVCLVSLSLNPRLIGGPPGLPRPVMPAVSDGGWRCCYSSPAVNGIDTPTTKPYLD